MNNLEPNPNVEKKCPQCGAALPPGALEGLCPACLLKQGASAETATQGETMAFEPPNLEELAKLFPQLEILELIGKGGMGAVYKARQPALDRMVALKILPPQVAAAPGFTERFCREARALAKLNHPNIVGIYDFGQVGGLAYFLMEYVDGLNLRQVQRAGKLSPSEALKIVPQICEALQFAHDEGIVHRDIKPENILLDKKGRVKIADFGIAKIMGREAQYALTETRAPIGTPQYMAPEQIEKPQSVDHRADIFSLGVVFYEMLTGELPLGKFAPPSSTARSVRVDVRLDDVVLRALEKEPERRYQQASQVKTAVETISSTPGSSSSAPVDAEAYRAGLAGHDYFLKIGSCLSRAWALVRSDFWPVVGINALIFILLWAVGVFPLSFGGHGLPGSSILSMLLYGPLMGGLYYSYLKRIRGEKVNVETAFSGFGPRFVQLLLGSLVSFLLVGIGLLCLVLPGIYFLVCWAYTVPLIIDKGIEFWPAMSISRQMVRKHWGKNALLLLVLTLLQFIGFLVFGFGIFFVAPIAAAALMYAYQDIFGSAVAPAATGPSGTQVLPSEKPGTFLKPVFIGAAAVVFLLLLVSMFVGVRHENRRREQAHRASAAAAHKASLALEQAVVERVQAEAEAPASTFGPVEERVLSSGINFKSGKSIPLPEPPASQNQDVDRAILSSLRKAELLGIDAYTVADEARLFAAGGTTFVPVTSVGWDGITVEEISTMVTNSHAGDEPVVVLEPGEQPQLAAFQTRDGNSGVLEIAPTNAEPGLRIRYKLVTTNAKAPVNGRQMHLELEDRLQAAKLMTLTNQRDHSFAAIATDAAKAGDVNIATTALHQISNAATRESSAEQAVSLLAQRGLRRDALKLAQEISNQTTRNRVLEELARANNE